MLISPLHLADGNSMHTFSLEGWEVLSTLAYATVFTEQSPYADSNSTGLANQRPGIVFAIDIQRKTS